MFAMHLTIILIISTNSIKCDHGLIWSDEFNGNDLDLKNWFIKSNDDICEKQFSPRGKSCNSEKNYEVTNGTIMLKVNREFILGYNYSGATIGTIKCFKNARVEIRARKPIGMQIHAAMVMYTYRGKCGTGKHHGQVEIVRLYNESEIYTSLHHGKRQSLDHVECFDLSHGEYQVYGFEWNSTNIRWFINNQTIYQANQTQDQFGRALNATKNPYYLPFDREFNIIFHIGVGCFAPENRSLPLLTKEEFDTWLSPSLDLDYIRVYGERSDQLSDSSLQTSTVVILSLAVLLVILVISLIFAMLMLRRQKAKNSKVKSREEDDIYDDIEDDQEHGKEDIYDDYLYTNHYTVFTEYDRIEDNSQAKIEYDDHQGDYLEMVPGADSS